MMVKVRLHDTAMQSGGEVQEVGAGSSSLVNLLLRNGGWWMRKNKC